MGFEKALEEELSVGLLTNKIYSLNAPEGTKAPYLVYLSSEGLPDKSLGGYMDSKEISGELNIVHDTYSQMKSLTATVIAKLQSFQGRVIGIGGPFIEDVTYEEPVEIYEPEIRKYRCHISFEVRI